MSGRLQMPRPPVLPPQVPSPCLHATAGPSAVNLTGSANPNLYPVIRTTRRILWQILCSSWETLHSLQCLAVARSTISLLTGSSGILARLTREPSDRWLAHPNICRGAACMHTHEPRSAQKHPAKLSSIVTCRLWGRRRRVLLASASALACTEATVRHQHS